MCHTVVAQDADAFEVDTSRATLDVTAGLEAGRRVNLEKSLRLADRLGGHLVSGHVDGVGTVVAFEERGGSARLVVEAPAELARYVARKGSIAVDGVSLTVNAVDGPSFEVNVIPHTRAVTTLGELARGRARQPRSRPAGALRRADARRIESGKIALLPEEAMTISPTHEIIDEIRRGRMVVLVDEEDRENEGDLVLAADFVTPEAINFMATPRARPDLPHAHRGALPAARTCR